MFYITMEWTQVSSYDGTFELSKTYVSLAMPHNYKKYNLSSILISSTCWMDPMYFQPKTIEDMRITKVRELFTTNDFWIVSIYEDSPLHVLACSEIKSVNIEQQSDYSVCSVHSWNLKVVG